MSAKAQPKVWFITGTSTGLGRCLTKYVLSRGHIVVATLRTPENLDDLKAKHTSDRLLIVRVDVSKPQDISVAFDKAREAFGRLDVVVNNAGYGMFGDAETTPDDVARGLFEVNFWGAVNVSKAAVKFFREVNKPGIGGRLINITSMAGINAFAASSFYCASKFALEGFTQSLAQELDPEWNIKVSMVEPGEFKSDAATRSAVILPLHPAYEKPGSPIVVSREYMSAKEQTGDPNKAVAKWFELAELPNPPLRLVLGQDAIGIVRAQIARLTQDVNAKEDWSKDLSFD